MLPADGVLLLAGMSILLSALRYANVWLFFRSNSVRLRQLATVPWPLRAKLSKPGYGVISRNILIVIKLAGLLLIAPIIVAVAAVWRSEWLTPLDVLTATLSLIALLGLVCLDRRAMTFLRQRYGLPADWKSLLR